MTSHNFRKYRNDRRQIIADWLKSVMASKKLKPTRWSSDAGLSPSTIGRALSPKYDNVLSASTLVALARSAGVPAPFTPGSGQGVPNVETLAEIFSVMIRRMMPNYHFSPETLIPYAQAFRAVLLEMADAPDIANDPTMADRLTRLAIRQALENDPQDD